MSHEFIDTLLRTVLEIRAHWYIVVRYYECVESYLLHVDMPDPGCSVRPSTAIRSNTEIRAISNTIPRTLPKKKLGVVGIWLVVEVLKDEIVPL
jgi:hypothetical protein